jgi:acetyl esterase/lipase
MRPRAYLLLPLLIPLLGVLLAGNANAATSLPPHEWGAPTGQSRGVMLVIHGGSWQGGQPNSLAPVRPIADFYRRRGWATLNLDARIGTASAFRSAPRVSRPAATSP